MSKEKFLSERQIFDLARELAKGKTQQQITDLLEENGRKVSVMAVNKMLKGEKNLLGLAMDWIVISYEGKAEWEGEEHATRYFKLLQN